VERKNFWKTEIALSKHYSRLNNYKRVIDMELERGEIGMEYFLGRESRLMETLLSVIKKIALLKISIETACKDMDIPYSNFNNHLTKYNGCKGLAKKTVQDKDLNKMAKYINS